MTVLAMVLQVFGLVALAAAGFMWAPAVGVAAAGASLLLAGVMLERDTDV